MKIKNPGRKADGVEIKVGDYRIPDRIWRFIPMKIGNHAYRRILYLQIPGLSTSDARNRHRCMGYTLRIKKYEES